LSTTIDRETAETFSGGDLSDPHLISILFEISIDSNHDSSFLPPFADISQLSYMKDENEILLCMGTVMQVVSITKINATSATVRL